MIPWPFLILPVQTLIDFVCVDNHRRRRKAVRCPQEEPSSEEEGHWCWMLNSPNYTKQDINDTSKFQQYYVHINACYFCFWSFPDTRWNAAMSKRTQVQQFHFLLPFLRNSFFCFLISFLFPLWRLAGGWPFSLTFSFYSLSYSDWKSTQDWHIGSDWVRAKVN